MPACVVSVLYCSLVTISTSNKAECVRSFLRNGWRENLTGGWRWWGQGMMKANEDQAGFKQHLSLESLGCPWGCPGEKTLNRVKKRPTEKENSKNLKSQSQRGQSVSQNKTCPALSELCLLAKPLKIESKGKWLSYKLFGYETIE